MAALDAVFKAYDVRGTVPDQLDGDLCRAIGAAFARFALDEGGRCDRILVARDMRPSGVELSAAFADGVASQGVDVVDLGLASTDLMYFASGTLDAPGAMFTASHNPAQYNGIKFCLAGAKAVGQDTGLDRIKELAASGVPPAATVGARSSQDLLAAFADHVRSFIDLSVLRPLKIVADTANGMGGLVVPAVFEALPFDLEILYGELDGTFPNHPADPIQPENQRALRARVQEVGADIGFAFDGDADRVFVVDEQGVGISGSTTTAMVAVAILDKQPGSTILHNLICSKAVPEIIREHGGTPIRTAGRPLLHQGRSWRRPARRSEASTRRTTTSGTTSAPTQAWSRRCTFSSNCVASGVPLSELRKPYDRYADSGEINTRVDDPAGVIERVAAEFHDAEQDRLDGLTVDLGDWWFNLRPSNTEPLLRLNLEARTRAECEEHVARVLDIITKG